jgi:glycosyltransferase involved in cell wall biosynthesis
MSDRHETTHGANQAVPTLSVILCAHNPRREYLDRTLDSLRRQTLPVSEWEFLLVDNASRDPLAPTVSLQWHPRARHLREEEVGLTLARIRGIREAVGRVLVFVDDDNVLRSDYLARAVAIEQDNPHLGVFGAGKLEPEFESEPRPALRPWLQHLALRTVARAQWSSNPEDYHSRPFGAGLCVATAIAHDFVRRVTEMGAVSVLGRRGNLLYCAEDDLFSQISVQAGLGFGVFPALGITHLISAPRVEPEYLLRLIRAHDCSNTVLRYLLGMRQVETSPVRSRLRAVLRGFTTGVFAMRAELAAQRGRADARRFIATHDLRHPSVGKTGQGDRHGS